MFVFRLLIFLLLVAWFLLFLRSQARPSFPLSAAPRSLSVPETAPSMTPDRLNLNEAGLEELDALPGIGPALAQAILDYRMETGAFFFPEELLDIPGIGEKRFDAIREWVTCFPPQR